MKRGRVIIAYVLCLCLLKVATVCGIQIQITAADRNGKIGDFFDATKSAFTGQNIFYTTAPSDDAITTFDITQADTKFEVVDSFSEKVALLGVESSLAIDVAVGSTHAIGAVSNLQDHLKNGRRKEAWLLHQIRTVQETLNFSTDLARSQFSRETLQTTSATHFVAGIQYGADILFKFFTQEFENKRKQDIKSDLEQDINSDNTSSSTSSKYFISVFSDVFLQSYPQNIQEVLSLLSNNVQSLIGQINSGKGKPIKYFLLPLVDLKSNWKFQNQNLKISHPISDSLLLQSIPALLDSIAAANQKLNDAQTTFDIYKNCIGPQDEKDLEVLKTNFNNLVLDFKQNLSLTLESVRSGSSNSTTLPNVIAEYNNTIFGESNFETKLENLTRQAEKKIEIYKNFITAGTEYVGKSDSIEVIRWQTMDRVLFVLFYDLNLIKNDGIAWQENTRLMLGPLNKLTNRLVIVDCGHHAFQCNGLNKTVIQEFRRGVLTRSVVTSEDVEINQGNQQCLFESLSLDTLQKKFRDYEASTKLTIKSLNATIDELLRNSSDHYEYFYSVNNTKGQPRPFAKASTRQNITNEFLSELTNHPKARLYSNENFTGHHEDYQAFSAWNKGSCFNLLTLNQQIKSIDSFGTCVRLFQLMDCAGWSLAIYPGSGKTLNLDSKLDGVYSVGPCLTNEFDNAFSINLLQQDSSESVQMVKKPGNDTSGFFTPDWILFGGVDNYMESYHLWDKENPITNFQQGSNNGRIEYIRAFIYQTHVRNEVQVNDLEISSFTRRQYEQFDREEGDTVGYAIPLKYGGPEDEIYNIFPQSVEGQAKWTEQLDEALEDKLTEGFYGFATVYLNFMYTNTNVSRPFAFAYHISINGPSDGDRVRYGVIEN